MQNTTFSVSYKNNVLDSRKLLEMQEIYQLPGSSPQREDTRSFSGYAENFK